MTEDRRDAQSESKQDDSFARLLGLAGPRTQVSPERAQRVREAVEAQWRQAVAAQPAPARVRPLRWAAGLAVAAAVVVAVALNVMRQPLTGTAKIATIDVVIGQARARLPGEDALDAASGLALSAGSILQTGADGRLGIRLASGQSLRVDVGSRLSVNDGELLLERGAVYIDSNPRAAEGTVSVVTALGVARHVGTQFEVRLVGDGLRVRVREGLVTLTPTADPLALEARAGEQLRLLAEGSVERERVPIHGPEWEWVSDLASEFVLEGGTLADFLSWICRENGWQLEYADDAVAQAAAHETLSGSIEGMSAQDALAAVLKSVDVGYRLDDGVLTVGQAK